MSTQPDESPGPDTSAFDSLPGYVWCSGADGGWSYVSPSWSALLVGGPASALGDGWQDAIHPDDRPGATAAWRAAVRDVKPFEAEFRVRCRDGGWRLLHARANPRRAAGRAAGFTGLAVELDGGELALRASERHYRTLAEHTPEVIARFDRQLRHTYLNEYGARVYGVPLGEVLGRTSAELGMPPDKVAFWKAEFERAFSTGEQRTVDFEFDSPNFGRQHFSSLFVPEFDEHGEVESILAITRDVTALRQAQQSLREERDFIAAVLDTAASLVVVLDSAGRIVRANKACEAATGYTEQELRGRSYQELIPPDELVGVRQTFDSLALGDFPSHHENSWQAKDGTRRLYAWANTAIADDVGRPKFVVGIGVDVTERKRAEETLRHRELQFRALIENLSSGVALVDSTGRFSLFNAQFLSLFGLSSDSDIKNVNDQDWSAWQVFDADGKLLDVDDHPVRKAALTRKPVRNQLVGVRLPSGQELVWILVSATPLLDASGQLEHLICTYHDVTERRRAEEALRASNQRKNEFLAMLSHELRNPLAPIRNSLYVLERASPGGQQALRSHQVIDRQVTHMTRLIDDLLDVTRISRGKIRLQREPVELCELVHRTAEDHRMVFQSLGVTLELTECGGPLLTSGDPTRLAQVVGNLLGNAAKFTLPGGRVTLALGEEHGLAVLRLRDDGIGIEPQALPELFEPFVQGVQALDRAKGGLGLGLALVKGLVELHGGSVSVASEGPGRGAEFTVRLPLDASARPQERAQSVPAAARHAQRVLVIEDNPDAADSLREALELGGHSVEVASTGLQGIEKALAFRPDVVLCDLGLPELDGYGVARRLRGDPRLRSVFLVALSGYALQEDVDRARQAGFDRHLAKPASVEALEKLLAQAQRDQATAGFA